MKIMKSSEPGARQGDVLLLKTSDLEQYKDNPEVKHILENLAEARKATWEKCKELTVKLGEQTGHHHTFFKTDAEDDLETVVVNGMRFLRLNTDRLLKHQEHPEIMFLKGEYVEIAEKTYNPWTKIYEKAVD